MCHKALIVVFFALVSAASADWQFHVIEYHGEDPAIAVDSQGRCAIAYGLEGLGARFAWFDGVNWQKEYIYQPVYGNTGWFDMVSDTNDIFHVVFGGSFYYGAAYAVEDSTSDGWTLDFLPEPAMYVSLDMKAHWEPFIAMLDRDEDNRFLYHGESGWHTELIEQGNDYNGSISLAMDETGNAHVAYNSAATSQNVRYALRDTPGQWTVSTIDSSMSSAPRGISMVLDQQDHPRISYNVSGELRYASWNGASWNVEAVFAMDTGPREYGTSLALDSQDNPHIVHCSSDSLLYTVNYGSGWETSALFAIGMTGGNPDLALDGVDRPHIAFYTGHPDRNLMCAFDDATGIEGPSPSASGSVELSISSNPFRDHLGICCSLAEASKADLLVYDIQGRLMETLNFTAGEGDYTASWIPKDTVPCGSYVIVLKTSDAAVCTRVVYLK